jgi:hypothetical protein
LIDYEEVEVGEKKKEKGGEGGGVVGVEQERSKDEWKEKEVR